VRTNALSRRIVFPALAVVALLVGCTPIAAQAPARNAAKGKTVNVRNVPASTMPVRSKVAHVNGSNVGVSLYGNVLEWSPATLATEFARVKAMGATWVRVPMNWVSLEMHGKGRYEWWASDRVVDAARKEGLRILGVVSYTPAWARPAGTPATNPPNDPDDYARFVAALADRYAPLGVHHWEIWNEPNVPFMWTPKPDPARYTTLLRKAFSAIKREDRRAVVLSAGLSPGWDAPDGSQMSPVTFLERMYRAGAKGSFHAVGYHPASFPYRSTYSASWNAFQQTPQLSAVMRAHGDAKKRIWATEIGFPTGRSSMAVSEQTQAKYLLEALRVWQASPYAGPAIVYSIRDFGTNPRNYDDNFGLVRYNGSPKPAYTAVKRELLGR
jgi:hypothetical protein